MAGAKRSDHLNPPVRPAREVAMETQTAVGAGEVCRLTVYGPKSRVELAVPAHVPVADLMPTVLGHLGPELATHGLDHGGWVLQRLGEAPLEEDLGTAALGLYDGDVLHLRPRNEQLAPVDFDDLVDGVATGIADRRDAWRPASTRRLLLGVGGLLLVVASLMLPLQSNGVIAAAAGLGLTSGLIGGAVSLVRAHDDAPAGAVLGFGALGFAAGSGLCLPALAGPVGPATALTGSGVLAAGGFLAIAAVAVRLGTGTQTAALNALTVGGALTAGAGMLALDGLDSAGAAAVILPVALLLSYAVPTVSAKLAGLHIAPPPVSPEEFQQDVDPVPATDLLRRTAVADEQITAFHAVLGLVISGCLLALVPDPGRSAAWLVICASALVLIHSRELVSSRQRVAMLAPGVVGLTALMIDWSIRAPGMEITGLAVPTVLGVGLVLLSKVVPGRRPMPHWGMAGDIAHWVVTAAVIPLCLAVLGVYGRVRGLWI
jgi:type VII secretion integral membrane protein EccD